MSHSLTPHLSFEPLQLDYFEPGSNGRLINSTHEKTVPHTIIAQVLEGKYEVTSGGERAVLPAGGIFAASGYTPLRITHHVGPNGVMKVRWLHFRFSLRGFVDYFSLYAIPLRLSRLAVQQLNPLLDQALALGPTARLDLRKLAQRYVVASQVLATLCTHSRLKQPDKLSQLRHGRLQPALDTIQRNYASPLSIEDLAHTSHLSVSHFHALFREEFGLPPLQYIRNFRLDLAARWLCESEQPLNRIATLVGFSDYFHFSRAFKSRHGTSPRRYREQAQS